MPARTFAKVFVLSEKETKNMVKLGEHVKKKIKIKTQIDAENIPRIVGGSCSCPEEICFEKNRGPWNPEGKGYLNL